MVWSKSSTALQLHCSTATITVVIVIFGAGVIGSSIAWHLAKRGRRDVVVYDRADTLGGGSTAKATGGIRVQFDNPTDVRLSMLSREKLREFDSGYAPRGYLFLARNEEELAMMRAAQQIQHACGATETRMLNASEARDVNPAIGDASIIGGAFGPRDGFIGPMNILHHYASEAQQLGVQFEFNVAFEEWIVRNDRVVAARTSRGEIEADMFVNAMGAWCGPPVVPVRRNVAATIATDLLPESMPMTIWAADWYHLRVRDGRILLLWADDPVVDDDEWLERVLAMTRERMPSIAHLPIEECWSGLYEMSPDEHALLGRAQYENLFVANGSSGHGVMHSPALGQLLSEIMLDGKASMDVSALRWERWRPAG